MIWALLEQIWPYIAGLLALIAGALGVYRRGKASQRQETALEAAERHAKTRKDMDDAEAALGDDPGTLREWLRARGQR